MITRVMYSPLDDNTIRSRHGYLYAICPRMYHYACRDRLMFYHPQDLRNIIYGLRKHREVQSSKQFSKMLVEYNYTRVLEKPILGINRFSIHADLSSLDEIIEIKPKYSIKAYYQTLIEKFTCPYKRIMIYEYVTDRLFEIQASYDKAKEKIARMIVSLRFIPPRFPNAYQNHKTCIKCKWHSECYSKNDSNSNVINYEEFTRLSQIIARALPPPNGGLYTVNRG